jgi:hypothetical protein
MRGTRAGWSALVLGMLGIVAAPLHAQLGVRAGVNYAVAAVRTGSTDVDTGHRWGYHVGAVYGGGFLVGYEIGAYYTQKGFSVGSGATGGDVKLDYVEIPLLLAVRLPFVRAYAGPAVAYRLACATAGTPSLGGSPFTCDGETRSVDVGLRAGLGMKFLLFSLDASYTRGSNDIAKSAGLEIRNRVVAVSLGLSLP